MLCADAASNGSPLRARSKPILAFLLAGMLGSHGAGADTGAPIERQLAGTLLDGSKFSTTRIPGGTASADALALLEYPDNSTEALAHKWDVTGDGVEDYIVASYRDTLCGTGGCPYVVLDGRSGSEIGSFFGFVAVLATRVNGYSVIQVISKRSIDSSGLSTYVHGRQGLQLVSHSILQAEGVKEWRNTLEAR